MIRGIVLDANGGIQVPILASQMPAVPGKRRAEDASIVDPTRDVDSQILLNQDPSQARAGVAGVHHVRTQAFAEGACLREHGAGVNHLARPATALAWGHLVGAPPFALGAVNLPGYVYGMVNHPAQALKEVKLQGNGYVLAGPRLPTGARRIGEGEGEEGPEVKGGVGEVVLTIILGLARRVGQGGIGFIDLGEHVRGLL